MTPQQVADRLAAGDKIHMQLGEAGRRMWWFDSPHAVVSDKTMQAVQRAGAVVEAGDSLFGLPQNSQTWLVADQFGDAP